MTSAAGAMLSFGALCSIASSIVTYMVTTIRRDRAENTRVEEEFAPVLTRWRPAIDVASRLRPVGQAVNAHRVLWSGRAVAALASLAGSVRAFLVDRVRAALAARVRATPVDRPRSVPAGPRPGGYANLDANNVVWPVNPAPAPAPPVGRVPVELDFDPMVEDFGAWLRGKTAELNHHIAQRAADPDTTGYIPRIPAEQVSR